MNDSKFPPFIQTIGRGMRVIEHKEELVPQTFVIDSLTELSERVMGRVIEETVTGRLTPRVRAEEQRFPTVGLGGDKSRALGLIGMDFGQLEAYAASDMLIVDEYHLNPLTADDFRSILARAECREPLPRPILSYEELQRISRQRMPTTGVNHSIYTRSFEPAGPAIVGKPKKHRSKTKRARIARKRNRR